jgi:Flp pilus assembly protein TadD
VYASWGRGGSAGVGFGVTPWRYLGTQCGAIAHYLKLCAWPSPLVLDYGRPLAHGAAEIVPYAVLVTALGLATAVALWRWPKLGFLGALFFVTLAPTSSVVPLLQTMAEHRIYLPLTAVATLIMVAIYAALRRLSARQWISERTAGVLGLCAAAAAALALAVATFERNRDYRDDLSIWRDTLAKAPSNSRAQNNLGVALLARGEFDEAMALFWKAMMSTASDPIANCNYYGNLARLGRMDAVIAECWRAVRRGPDSAEARRNLAWQLATCPAASRRNGAAALEHALLADQLSYGRSPEALDALAAAYAELGRFPDALAAAKKGLELATERDKRKLAADIRARMALYQSGKPYRQPLPPYSPQSQIPNPQSPTPLP